MLLRNPYLIELQTKLLYAIITLFIFTQSLRFSKLLMRDLERDTLYKVNKAECDRLVERWQSDECVQAIMNFFQKSS